MGITAVAYVAQQQTLKNHQLIPLSIYSYLKIKQTTYRFFLIDLHFSDKKTCIMFST